MGSIVAGLLTETDIGDLWDVAPGYLNTALRGIPPRASVRAAQSLLQRWATGRLDWRDWLDAISGVRSAWAGLLGVEATQVGVGHTSASLMAAVARALPTGGRVITLAREHNSCTIPFREAGDGLTVESVEPAALSERLGKGGYAALAISVVQSLDGSVVDLAALRPLLDRAGALLCVDATQAVGWLPFDPTVADFVTCASYKWLMGPNGPAFAWAAPQLMSRLRPAAPNWFACEDPHAAPYGADFRLAADGRRLDVVPGLLSLAALAPSLELIGRLGVARIHAHDLALAAHVRRGLRLAETGSAIVTARHPDAADALRRAGLVFTSRDDRVRLAFHLHNRQPDADRVLEALDGLALEP